VKTAESRARASRFGGEPTLGAKKSHAIRARSVERDQQNVSAAECLAASPAAFCCDALATTLAARLMRQNNPRIAVIIQTPFPG